MEPVAEGGEGGHCEGAEVEVEWGPVRILDREM